jgi:monofunctional biosynthetic peptidoglycan transglycosylase
MGRASLTRRKRRSRSGSGALRWIGAPAGLIALASAAAFAAYEVHGLPSGELIAKLKSTPVRETALMRERKTQAARAHRPFALRQVWVDYPRISPAVIAAVVASEDARFFEHAGLDLKEIHNALHDSLSEGRTLRGASTLTQQLAKNLWLSGDRSLLRKLKEAWLARRMEERLSKRRILTLYLNVAEWGEGVFGIEAAARTWCDKDAWQLSLAEAAALASMLPNPHRFTPKAKPVLLKRAAHVLDRVAEERLATPQELEAARVELVAWLGQGAARTSQEPAPEENFSEKAREASAPSAGAGESASSGTAQAPQEPPGAQP